MQTFVSEEVREKWEYLLHLADRTRPFLDDHMEIKYTHVAKHKVEAIMPITEKICHNNGKLDRGSNIALAESLASMAASLHVDMTKEAIVGLEINASLVQSATGSHVKGSTYPISIGQKNHVWGIEIRDENGQLVCISRCTASVIPVSHREPINADKSELLDCAYKYALIFFFRSQK